MNRLQFLQRLGLSALAAAIAPKIIKSQPASVPMDCPLPPGGREIDLWIYRNGIWEIIPATAPKGGWEIPNQSGMNAPKLVHADRESSVRYQLPFAE